MSSNPKIIKRENILTDDLQRLVKSMRKMLARKYPDPVQRKNVALRIMQEVRGVI